MYAKIYEQILDSSIADDPDTRHIFMDLLVLADPAGRVDKTFSAIAARLRIDECKIRLAISKLCKPDVNSRSHEADGARLVPLDPEREWGWQIVNFAQYRDAKTEIGRREYMRLYMQKRRRVKRNLLTGKPNSKPVKLTVNHAEADANEGASAEEEKKEQYPVSNTYTPPTQEHLPLPASPSPSPEPEDANDEEPTDSERATAILRMAEALHIAGHSSDHQSLVNVAQALGSKELKRAVGFAQECANSFTAENPIACFFARLKKDLGYISDTAERKGVK